MESCLIAIKLIVFHVVCKRGKHGRALAPSCLVFKQCREILCKSSTWRGHTRLVQSYPHDCPVPTGITTAGVNPGCLKKMQRSRWAYESTTCKCHTGLVQSYPHDCPVLAGITLAAAFGWRALVKARFSRPSKKPHGPGFRRLGVLGRRSTRRHRCSFRR